MATYTVIKKTDGSILSIRRDDGASIPVCEENSDYQQYLSDVTTHGPYPAETIPDPEPPVDRIGNIEMALLELGEALL